MRIALLLVIFSGIINIAKAQQPGQPSENNSISGTVTDTASGKTLEYATITLFLQNGKKPVNGTITGKGGEFVLNNIGPGNYRLVVEFIGYEPHTDNIHIDSKSGATRLSAIALIKKQKSLQAVTVTGQKPLIENKIDRMVFNAEKDITSQAGVATDILKKVPMVSVDVDGNVQLAGSPGIRFLINGKPSAMFGQNISEVLQSIPASQVQSIEVITNPGAKYDAQGMGGIINIILKKNTARGYMVTCHSQPAPERKTGLSTLICAKENSG